MKQQYNIPLLKDTSLCAIVRDEEMNPAGGIRDYLHCVLPFIEQAIVVDTGSTDKTREILEEMQGVYKNLKVFEHEFDGFAQSRNFGLKKVKTKYSLFLDADERIKRDGFEAIQKQMQRFDDSPGHCINILRVGKEIYASGGHNPRIVLNKKGNHFENAFGLVYEWIYHKPGERIDGKLPVSKDIKLYHFTSDHLLPFKDTWYSSLMILDSRSSDKITNPKKINGYIYKRELNSNRFEKQFQGNLGLPDYRLDKSMLDTWCL